jgi:hypothetical protein
MFAVNGVAGPSPEKKKKLFTSMYVYPIIQNVSSCLVYIEKFLIGGGCWTIHDDGKSKREKEEVSAFYFPHVFGRIPTAGASYI